MSSWINLHTQQPLKAESERSENVESKPESKKDIKDDVPAREEKVYYNKVEEEKQFNLWNEATKKEKWYDAPPKVKVTTKNGLCHMKIEFTVGWSPDATYDLITNPTGAGSAFFDYQKWREIMKTKSRKVLREDGPRKIVKSEQDLAWDVLSWSIPIPISLIVDENRKDLRTKYKKAKMMFMKVFKGSYKVEPIYVDSERLCKQSLPKSREEYIKCSGGEGRIASKVIMDQYFQPYPLFNLPPLSWYIRGITIKTTKNLLKAVQNTSIRIRGAKTG